MRLKSFYAKTMTEAMQMVRDTLGEDAIIVATREERGGKAVRVTAAIEEDMPVYRSGNAGDDIAFELGKGAAGGWLQYDDEEDNDHAFNEALMDALLKHNVPEDVLDHIVSCATVMDIDDPAVALVGALETLFSFQPLPVKSYRKAMMLVGPPGSGKTLAAAKIAARGVMNDLSVAVITTDIVRAGGVEQLEAFTRLLKLDLHKAKGPNELAKILKALTNTDQIIIDTPGLNPFDAAHMKELAKLVVAGDVEPVLVLPAAIDATESGEIARVFSAMGVKRLLPSRVDIARRLGGLLNAAHQGSLIFSDVSDTAQVADGLTPLSARRLGGYFMKPNASKITASAGSEKKHSAKQSISRSKQSR